MSKIAEFNIAKVNLARFKEWRSLIGKEYFGGTRGKGGQYGKIVNASSELEIYHQEYDGARNYHGSKDFHEAFSVAAKKLAPQLMEEAEKFLTEKMQALANDAAQEYREILEITQEESK